MSNECKADKHLKPRRTGLQLGKNDDGSSWKEEYMQCDSCGALWTVTSGKK